MDATRNGCESNFYNSFVYCLKSDLRISIQSCRFVSRCEPFLKWLANVFLTNNTYSSEWDMNR